MILQVTDDGSLKNMHVAHYPEMVLFHPRLSFENASIPESGKITVAFRPPEAEEKTLDIPLLPDTVGLEDIDVNMHKSPTKAYNMGSRYNDWFSACFGYDVVLAYLGDRTRAVLMSTSGNRQKTGSWLSSMASQLPASISNLMQSDADAITFADCAPFLVCSDKSMDDVDSRLPNGKQESRFDVSKFRPNILVSGAAKEWEEDFWAEVTFGDAKLHLLHNCARCQSINIDYATGKPGTGEAGKMLKKLQSDRRVDPGSKYSPIFGRYSFLDSSSEGMIIAVGDEVVVKKRNAERTRFGE